MSKKVIIMDRDGTINLDKGYVYKEEDFHFLEGVPEAIKMFHELGYLVIVITNQSGVARAYYKEQDVLKLHSYVNTLLSNYDTRIDGFYFCPHHPEGVVKEYRKDCSCRKPETGLFLKAIDEFDIDIKNSWAIGDNERDVLPAISLGMNAAIINSENKKLENVSSFLCIKQFSEYLGKWKG